MYCIQGETLEGTRAGDIERISKGTFAMRSRSVHNTFTAFRTPLERNSCTSRVNLRSCPGGAMDVLVDSLYRPVKQLPS